MAAFVRQVVFNYGPDARRYGDPYHGTVTLRMEGPGLAVMENLNGQDFSATDRRALWELMCLLGVDVYREQRRGVWRCFVRNGGGFDRV